jgi:hypothetical protein
VAELADLFQSDTSGLSLLLIAFGIYAIMTAIGLMLYRRYRLNRADGAWKQWRSQQHGRMFAWRMVFGKPPVPRLTDRSGETRARDQTAAGPGT